MKHTLRKLILALSITAIATGASPSFAQDSGTPAPPVPASESRYISKGPVHLYIEQDKKLDELRIVNRSNVVGANVANVAVGISLALLGAPVPIEGNNKERFYGDPITDTPNRRNLVSPLVADFPAALDQKITELVGDNDGSGATPYKNSIMITPRGWSLVYQELMADKEHEDKHVLRFAAQFTKRPEGAEERFMLKRPKTIEQFCQYLSKPRSLTEWKMNDYEAVAVEQKLATQSCMDTVMTYLPEMLGIDTSAKIRSAKIHCKTEMNQCVAETSTAPDQKEAKKACKVEYNQCVSDDVKPLVETTPIGKCKATYSACKSTVLDKARALNPGVKPEKSEFLPCANEYKACIAANK